jgi:hypothetical protein
MDVDMSDEIKFSNGSTITLSEAGEADVPYKGILSDAEKLQKLIELAWDNGYRGPLWWNCDDDEVNPDLAEDLLLDRTEFNVIFDLEFIKALCKSIPFKKAGYDNPEYWRYIIKLLALAENRIDYLYGVFCNE